MKNYKQIEHHVKYLELDGVDETVFMSRSEHKKLHAALNKIGILVPVNIAVAANHRTAKWKKYSAEYDKNYAGKQKNQKKQNAKLKQMWFSETLEPHVELREHLVYNPVSGCVYYSSGFHANNRLELYNIEV